MLDKVVVKAKKLKEARKEDEEKNAAAEEMDIEEEPRHQEGEDIYSE